MYAVPIQLPSAGGVESDQICLLYDHFQYTDEEAGTEVRHRTHLPECSAHPSRESVKPNTCASLEQLPVS